ncbi:nuclease-related domain-containing DEAD/DEAH box helicase [Bradyrhizobium neotropicale]|uniref:nuclease-related domain-containing DEAD/DEAH box helicase n=1 Tax=Bradyrhizobium neotropicale TaxID=1497615 RepID=UPI001FEDF627|nr:AAA family ATPase [Bradyrhizobium neotropicale]
MIPPEIRSELSSGEIRVFEEIKNADSARKWVVFHSLSMSSAYSGRYGEIDFVILIPGRGIVCVEVKGGGVACVGGYWTTTNRKGVTERLKRSPFEQATDGMWKLIKFVQRRFGENSPEARCPMGWMVVFPDVACPPASPEFARSEVIDRGQLTNVVKLIEDCPSLAREIDNPQRTVPAAHTFRRLIEALRPDFERPANEANLIWHSETRIRELTTQQAEALRGIYRNRRALIEGGAGTGKTVLAIQAARDYAAQGKRVLLTCFNRNLGQWLAELTRPTTDIVCSSVHKLLLERIEKSSASSLLPRRNDREDSFGADFFSLGAMAIGELEETFDMIIVDEVQDFRPPELLEVLVAWGAEASGTRVLLCGDFARQALYGTAPSGPTQFVEALPGMFEFAISHNCRNTRRIARAMDLTVGPTGAKVLDQQVDGAPVDFLTYKDVRSQLDKVDLVVRSLLDAGCRAEDIIILGPRRLENSCLAGSQKVGGLTIRRFEEGDPQAASYATIHSFKGLERTAVVLVDLSHELGPASDALLYVGMSRARSRLVLLIDEGSLGWLQDLQARNFEEVGST